MTLLDQLTAAVTPLGAKAQKMFSGTGFMLNGNLLIGTSRDGLIVRVGKADEAAAAELEGASVMEMRGKQMPGWIIVSADGCKTNAQIQQWLTMALAFNKTLPSKAAKPAKKSVKMAKTQA